jgi:hypothetical protein
MAAFLRIQVNKYKSNWSSWLPYWCFAYNTTVHTQTNYTPYELVFGKLCVLPSNILNKEGQVDPLYNLDDYSCELKYRLQCAQKEAHDNLIKEKEKRKITYDKNSRLMSINKGDLVLVKIEDRKKLDPIFKGPFEVEEVESPNVRLKVGNKSKLIHKDRVKPYNR